MCLRNMWMAPNRFLPLVIHIIMKAILNQSLQRCSPDINIDEKGEGADNSLRKKSNVINVAGANQKQVSHTVFKPKFRIQFVILFWKNSAYFLLFTVCRCQPYDQSYIPPKSFKKTMS